MVIVLTATCANFKHYTTATKDIFVYVCQLFLVTHTKIHKMVLYSVLVDIYRHISWQTEYMTLILNHWMEKPLVRYVSSQYIL